jgi:ubiquinone/menaquinone biosynthesis C-methylase UbiE
MSDTRVLKYYESTAEDQRLSRREGQLELVRTMELLRRFLPPSPARIIDIGGGTGVHSSWLSAAGYTVHLVDIVPAHIEEALKAGGFTAEIGDARSLSVPDGAYVVALVFGPLYHLADREERLQALREAYRVVHPSGIVVVAFISRAAAILDGYAKGWIDRPGANGLVEEQMRNGFTASAGGFASVSYFHWPAEAQDELRLAGLEELAMLGVEGPGWMASNFEERWARADGRETVVESARVCEEHPELRLLSSHLLAFCRPA